MGAAVGAALLVRGVWQRDPIVAALATPPSFALSVTVFPGTHAGPAVSSLGGVGVVGMARYLGSSPLSLDFELICHVSASDFLRYFYPAVRQ